MSDVDTYRGRLIPVDLEGQTLNQWIQKRLDRIELKDYEFSWLDALHEELYDSYHYDRNSGILYEVQRERFDPEGFVHARHNSDGTIDFLVSYYNGGASFGEVMDEVVDREDSGAPSFF